MKDLKLLVAKIPHSPGVYIYKDQNNKIIYIGKAKNLRKRVSSYFSKQQQNLKTSLLLENISDIEYTITPTEIDALTLEDQLINKHKPKYNILLKEDSSYRYICITRSNPPQITVSRKPIKKQYCLGPFPFATHNIVKVARDILGLTKYKQIVSNNWQLYLDAASFRKKQSNTTFDEETYKNFINKLVKTIKKGDHTLIQEYTKRMHHHSEKLEFEQALQYKNKIELLERIAQRTTSITPTPTESEHLIIEIEHQDKILIFLFQVRQGLLHNMKKFSFQNQSGQLNILNSFLKQYYSNHQPPKRISIYSEQKYLIDPAIGDYLSNNWGSGVNLETVKKHKLLELAYKNINSKLNIKNELSSELKTLFSLKIFPETVDFIDISNVSDAVVVGGVVRFNNGKPTKSLWRHYNIKSFEGQDDYASMREVIERRYSKINLPDILIVDGGVGQLNAVLSALPKNKSTFAVGLAKAEETLIFPNGSSVKVRQNSTAGKFIIKGRDTVHNFVITHSRAAFKKVYKKSFLDDIAGIGPATKHKLLSHFKSPDAIKKASIVELEKIIGKTRAKLIK